MEKNVKYINYRSGNAAICVLDERKQNSEAKTSAVKFPNRFNNQLTRKSHCGIDQCT